MIMNSKHIEKALTKVYNSLLFKNILNFKVEVKTEIFDIRLHYYITIYVTVDHAKFWSESSSYDSDYNDLMNNIVENYEEKADSLAKYILPTESYSVYFKFEHYNTDVYEPLLKYLGEEGYSFKVEHENYSPSFGIVIDENDVDGDNSWNEIMEDLSSKFDTDDIVFYYGDLNI